MGDYQLNTKGTRSSVSHITSGSQSYHKKWQSKPVKKSKIKNYRHCNTIDCVEETLESLTHNRQFH
jgi:hypothetical protein